MIIVGNNVGRKTGKPYFDSSLKLFINTKRTGVIL